ncbi:MAG: hypothetical protein WA162_08505, partial [Thermodesulfobacteriota bacterium]
EPDGTVVLPLSVTLRQGESLVMSLLWDPVNSVVKRYIFEPDIKVKPQIPSAKDVMLFVSNSGSNYISVIDKSLERVIAAITVGKNPTGMAVNNAKSVVYVLNSGSGTVTEIDAIGLSVRDTIPLPSGMGPSDIAFVPKFENAEEGKLYVVNRISNDVTVIDTFSKMVLSAIKVGTEPTFIAFDPKRRDIYVTNETSNDLNIINVESDSIVATVKLDAKPVGAALGNGVIYVFQEGLGSIAVISLSTRQIIERIMPGQQPRRGVRGFNGMLFVVNTKSGSISFLNSGGGVQRSVASGKAPLGIALDERRNRVYVSDYGGNSVFMFDPFGERLVNTLTVGSNPYKAVQLD